MAGFILGSSPRTAMTVGHVWSLSLPLEVAWRHYWWPGLRPAMTAKYVRSKYAKSEYAKYKASSLFSILWGESGRRGRPSLFGSVRQLLRHSGTGQGGPVARCGANGSTGGSPMKKPS